MAVTNYNLHLMENKIYESWADDLKIEAPVWCSHEEANGWNMGLSKGYVQGCNKMEDVCLKFVEWKSRLNNVWALSSHRRREWQSFETGETKTTAELFQYFLNNVYGKGK